MKIITRISEGRLPAPEKDPELKQLKALCNLMAGCWNGEASGRPSAQQCQKRIEWMVRRLSKALHSY